MYIYSSYHTETDISNPTPKAPRGKRSDLTEKDLEEFRASFSEFFHDEIF